VNAREMQVARSAGYRSVVNSQVQQYWDPDKAEGFFHTFSGWLVFVVALAMLFLLHRLLQMGQKNQEAQP
jgi:exosortase/archaeosortase family protein